jgi:pimeloyl-ACP methyl ester carboxylesterase
MQMYWNWFQAADQQRGRGEPSLIAGITSQVIDEYEVAEGMVYVAGMSAGGAMAAILGTTYPDLYAAVGVHSGLAPGSAHDLASAFTAMRQGGPVVAHKDVAEGEYREILPTIVFCGDGDTTVHPRNGDRLLAHLARGGNGSSPRVRTRQGQVPGGYEYTRFTYRDAEGRDLVERARARPRLVGRELPRLVHGSQRTRCLGRDGALRRAAPQTVERPSVAHQRPALHRVHPPGRKIVVRACASRLEAALLAFVLRAVFASK